MLGQQSTALTQWSGEPSGGQLLTPFITPSSQLHFDWNTAVLDEDEEFLSAPFGLARFKTSVEVTGELSPQAQVHALQVAVCIYVLNRFNSENLARACYSLVDMYDWQQIDQAEQRASVPNLQSIGPTIAATKSTSVASYEQLRQRIYLDGNVRAGSQNLVLSLDDLFRLVGQGSYSELDMLMSSLDVSRAAPEYLVGILRATSKISQHLTQWSSFLSKVRSELEDRKFDPVSTLAGLL
jgi:hypothetical protein